MNAIRSFYTGAQIVAAVNIIILTIPVKAVYVGFVEVRDRVW